MFSPAMLLQHLRGVRSRTAMTVLALGSAFALASPWPDPATMTNDVYA